MITCGFSSLAPAGVLTAVVTDGVDAPASSSDEDRPAATPPANATVAIASPPTTAKKPRLRAFCMLSVYPNCPQRSAAGLDGAFYSPAMSGPMPISLNDALAQLTFLPDRTPMGSEDSSSAFARLSPYRDGGIFVGHWAGESEWERHSVADEIVMILEGETTITFRKRGRRRIGGHDCRPARGGSARALGTGSTRPRQ